MARPRSYRAAALILKRRDMGEADRLLTILTAQQGKSDVLAKGARKPDSAKSGHVELFTKVDVLVALGRDLDILTQAEVLEPYLPLREDLERGAYAAYVTELIDRFVLTDEDHQAALFHLLDETYARLCVDADLRRVARWYELRLLDAVGFRPQLHECVVSHEPILPEDQFFSLADGGVVAPHSATPSPHLLPLPLGALKLLRHLQRSAYKQVASLVISEALHRDAERLMLAYLRYLLERRLQSVDFLLRLRQHP